MPQLKQLSCCLQWSDTGAPFQEHGTVYGDGVVETFVLVPNKPQGFSIRLTSRGYIGEGLVMIVFIDGNYQCNRSRVNLLPPAKDRPVNRTEIDFLLRQREKSQGDGLYLGREWRFDNHNIVEETPAGFQESHFDDLGVIEVLVLRCIARNKEDAEYEGSSSGEDSDVFGERPSMEDQQELSTTIPTTAPDSQPPMAAETSGVEDFGMGFMGLFDGASDPPQPPPCDGGHDGPPGRWIWHQSQAPFAGPPGQHQHHQPEGYHFHQQSHGQPTTLSLPHPHHDRQTFPGPPGRRVHFDDSYPPPRMSGTQGRAPELHQPQPQRPASRTRERSSFSRSQNSHTRPYAPQRIDSPLQDVERHHAPRPSSRQNEYRDQSSEWGYGNGHRSRSTDRISSHSRPQSSQDRRDSGDRNHEQGSQQTSGQKNQDPSSIPYSRTSPTTTRHQDLPQPNSTNNSQANASRRPSMDESRQPMRSASTPYSIDPEYMQYARPYYATSNHGVPASYAPGLAHNLYPYLPQVPPGYHYQQNMHPQRWPMHYPYAYNPVDGRLPPEIPVDLRFHPPYTSRPGFEEHLSPTQIKINGGHMGPNSWHDQTEFGQAGYVDSQENANPSGQNDVNANWPSNSPNNANEPPLNSGDSNAEGNGWDANGKDEGAISNGNTQNDAWDNNNNDNPNGDGNDQAADEWGNDNNNENVDTSGAGNNNENYQGGWNETAASGGVPADSSAIAGVGSVADAPRDLYGPHGPYYALRALRNGEPRPDAGEEPRFDVPKALALKRGSTKQVQPGPGYRYYKKRMVAEYIDSLDNPYARFVFKYRTKDQLHSEVGIEVDVEPTGDAEIQDLQNLDKQALIEMLMRAKSALGGKVPSPPSTPSLSTRGNEENAPIAIEAPKHPYLKYSLPPLRPNNVNSTGSSSSATRSASSREKKSSRQGDESGWGTSNDNSKPGWDDSGNGATKEGAWGVKASGWDGAAGTKSQGGSASSSAEWKKSSPAEPIGSAGSRKLLHSTPPRPVTPPGCPPQQSRDTAEANWDHAENTSGGGQNNADTVW